MTADLTGRVLGRWTVVGHRQRENGVTTWLCRCECGNEIRVRSGNLLNGSSQSCGCLKVEARRTHGLHRSPEYQVWNRMRQRCFNPKESSFPHYGGRGITVCREWQTSFAAFIRDMGRRPTSKHSIEQINNDGDYEPKNCKWATMKEQAHNTSRTRWLTHEGETLCLTEWSERLGIPIRTLTRNLNQGLTIAEIIEIRKSALRQSKIDNMKRQWRDRKHIPASTHQP